MCEHKVSLSLCIKAISTKQPQRIAEFGLSKQNTVIALHLIFLNPANSNVELLSARAEQLRKQDYSLWQHLEAARASRREKWSWLTAADNGTAIFIFVFGKEQLSHSTANHSQLFCLNIASVTLDSVLEWSVTEEFPNPNRVIGVKWLRVLRVSNY